MVREDFNRGDIVRSGWSTEYGSACEWIAVFDGYMDEESSDYYASAVYFTEDTVNNYKNTMEVRDGDLIPCELQQWTVKASQEEIEFFHMKMQEFTKINKMNISLIVAAASDWEIGYKGKLLYKIPEDLKRFKEITWGHTVIMGRKTFDSLPNGALPGRRNIVLSRNRDLVIPGCECYTSLDEALLQCCDEEEVFVIGGQSVYESAMRFANRIYLTQVHDVPEHADAYFPAIPYSGWVITKKQYHPGTDQNSIAYSFINLERDHNPGT